MHDLCFLTADGEAKFFSAGPGETVHETLEPIFSVAGKSCIISKQQLPYQDTCDISLGSQMG